MSSPVTILRADTSHLDAINAIERACFSDDAFTRRQLGYLIHQAQGVCLVALDRSCVIGYVSLLARRNAGNLRIYSVAVAPEARSCGVGQALVEAAITEARRRGLSQVTLEVRTDNAPAIALYTRNGFTAERLLRGYYHDGTDARRMVLCIER